MARLRLDQLKAALEARPRTNDLSESAYKRKLVDQINHLSGGRARRIEDRWAVGVLDLIIKIPGHDVVMAEGKVVAGNVFGPSLSQHEEGQRWQDAGVRCLLIGWKANRMYVSTWCDEADIRHCFSAPSVSFAEGLMEFLR